MPINSNNFLRWYGSFIDPEYSFDVSNGTIDFYANDDFITFNPFTVTAASASLGINPRSFKITGFRNGSGDPITMQQPYFWDAETQLLTIYRPTIDPPALDTVAIDFTFEDGAGHLYDSTTSGTIIQIAYSPILTAWVAYAPSVYCALDSFGDNNGLQGWTQLKLVNASTLTDISPLTLKPNIISDPDYIAPVTNLISCPVSTGGVYAPLTIGNFSLNAANGSGNYIVITQVTIACSACGAGGAAVVQNFPCNIEPGKTQRFNLPALSWDTGITLQYTVNGDMVTVTYPILWRSQVSGVTDNFPTGGPHQVDNSGVYGNFPLTVSYPNGLTIFCQ
jgi:hypothetical protein